MSCTFFTCHVTLLHMLQDGHAQAGWQASLRAQRTGLLVISIGTFISY